MRIEPSKRQIAANDSDSNSWFISYNYMYLLHKYNLLNIYVMYQQFSSTMYARDQA